MGTRDSVTKTKSGWTRGLTRPKIAATSKMVRAAFAGLPVTSSQMPGRSQVATPRDRALTKNRRITPLVFHVRHNDHFRDLPCCALRHAAGPR